MPEWIDPSGLSVSDECLKLFDAFIVHHHQALPIRFEDEALVVAVENPAEPDIEDRLRFAFNREVRLVAMPLAELKLALWRFYGPCPWEWNADL